MPRNDTDAIVEVATLCAAARAKLPVSGFHRLRVLLDMILIDLDRESDAPGQAASTSASDIAGRGEQGT